MNPKPAYYLQNALIKTRLIAVSGLLAITILFGIKPVSAEPTTAAILSATAAVAQIGTALANLYNSGSGPDSTELIKQNRELLIAVHERLSAYDEAFKKLFDLIEKLPVEIQFLLEERSALDRAIALTAAITRMENLYKIIGDGATAIGDPNIRFEDLDREIYKMMQYDDIFASHYISGMLIMLDSIHMIEPMRRFSQRDKKINLDNSLANYIKKLEDVLDESQPNSLAGRAEDLKSKLEITRSVYIAKLSALDAAAEKTFTSSFLTRSLLVDNLELFRDLQWEFELFWNINQFREIGGNTLWMWDEFFLGRGSETITGESFEQRCPTVFPVEGYYTYLFDRVDAVELASKFIQATNQKRNELDVQVKLLQYYNYILRNVRYALSVFKSDVWSSTSDTIAIGLESEPKEFDLLSFHDEFVDRFNRTMGDKIIFLMPKGSWFTRYSTKEVRCPDSLDGFELEGMAGREPSSPSRPRTARVGSAVRAS